MSADARRELGELLADQLDNIDPLTLREQRDQARSMAARLWDELSVVEDERDTALQRAEKAENTPC